ncbi:DUF4097 family beta strand repeat protein [candidate division KSB1 bacterium]|nr:DUF4097 family beta strand repeat protein [candidate division KSB1 bacterium]
MIDSDMGSIDIQTAPGDKVEARILIKLRNGSESKLERMLSELDLDSFQSGNDVTITLEKKKKDWWSGIKNSGLSVEFEVTVPQQYNVDLKTSGGSISVADLEGSVDARSSGGSLNMGDIQGPVTGHTSGGSITVQSCAGDVDVRTSGGSLKLGNIDGTVIGRTSGGSIHVDEVMGMIDAKTSGGGIHVAIAKQPEAECNLSTSGGGITAYLAENISMNVDAKTSGGGVSTDFPVKVEGKISGQSLRAEINGGGPLLTLRTSGGGIHIKKIEK